jgi:hypothetical protein
VEDLGAHAQRLAKRARADRHHHELLQVDGVVGVRAAVEDVEHRHRQTRAPSRRDSVERLPSAAARPAPRERHAEDRVGAEPLLLACRRARSSAGRSPPAARIAPDELPRDRALTFSTARVTPFPP